MNYITLHIDGQGHKVKFGFKANKILAKKWGFKTIGQIGAKIHKGLQFKEGEEPDLDQLDIIGDLVLSGILSQNAEAEVDSDEVVQAIFMDFEKLPALIQLFMDGMPKTKSPEPVKNAKRGKKK